MKKISTLFLIVLCICVAAVFVSCGDHTHAWDEGTVTTEATCMYTGTVVYKCECGKTKVATIDKLAHDFETTISYDNAYHYYACKADKCTAAKDLAEHDWKIDNSVTVNATCKSQGSKTYNCADCGAKKTENIAQIKEHVWNAGVITTVQTCQNAGVKTYTCTICSDTRTEELPVVDHVFSETLSFNETHHYYACVTAGCEEIKEDTYAEHVWGEGTVTIEPTCAAVGEKVYTCSCGATKIEEIATLPHVFSDSFHSNSTYHYHYCTKPGCNATDEKIAHIWDAGVVTTAPTPDADGVKTFTCSCGRTKTQVELYHEYSDEWTFDENKHYKKCTIRGHEDVSEEEAHEWDNGIVTVYPTPTMNGEIVYSCKCGCKDVRPMLYDEEAAASYANSVQWNNAFTKENFENVTLSGKWYVDTKNYHEFTVKCDGNMTCIEVNVGEAVNKLFFAVEGETNYVYTYDAEALVWTKTESDFAYTSEYFYNLFNSNGKFFDFVFNLRDNTYTAKNITLGETKYSKIAYAFENGILCGIDASIDGAISFVGKEFIGVELELSDFGETTVELPEIEEPTP